MQVCKTFKFYLKVTVACIRRVARALARLCWRWPFALCPWIRVTFAAGRDDLARLGIGSSVWLIANHVSFLDTVLFAAFVPPTTLARFQCLADARLFKLPLLGTVLKACGNIPVYFAKPESSGFSTDKARSEETAARLETSVGRGGSIAVYPEGQMNRADPASLQPFRHGGFRVPLRHDMAIYAWVAAGNAECWPRNVAIGGMPADIRVACNGLIVKHSCLKLLAEVSLPVGTPKCPFLPCTDPVIVVGATCVLFGHQP